MSGKRMLSRQDSVSKLFIIFAITDMVFFFGGGQGIYCALQSLQTHLMNHGQESFQASSYQWIFVG